MIPTSAQIMLGRFAMRLRAAAVSCLILLVPTLLFAQPDDLQSVIAALDKKATEMAQDPKAASFTLALVRPSGLVWTKSYGYADIAAKKSADTDTVYRVGSIT